MSIKNTRRQTTVGIQSDPIDNGNDILQSKKSPINVQNVSVDNTDNEIKFSSIKKNRTRREQSQNSYAFAKPIPSNSFSRNIQPQILSSLAIRGFSTTTILSPRYTKKKNDEPNFSKSSIKIGSVSGINRFLLEHSISNLRPEIIASLEWIPNQPIGNQENLIDSLIDFRFTTRMLQIENVQETIKKLKEINIGGAFNVLEQRYKYFRELEETQLGYRRITLQTLKEAKSALDIKDNYANERSKAAEIFSTKTGAKLPNGNFTLQDLFINELGFSEAGYRKFSNSKVYGQLIADLYNMCKYHSSKLIVDKKGHRADDLSSTSINTLFIPKQKSYNFRSWQIGNRNSNIENNPASSRGFNVINYKDYNSFISSLPSSNADKLKVLLTSLSNELIISAGIGYLTGTKLGKRFNVDFSDPFQYALGRVRSNILDDGFPPGSLSSAVLIEDSTGKLILPFETRNFYDEKGKTAVAGSIALVDVIMRFGDIADGLNYEPYYKFGKQLKKDTDDVSEYLDNLLNLSDEERNLHPKTIYLQVLKQIENCIIGLTNEKNKSEHQIIIAALMKLAQNNSRIRHLLLRYILELRDANDQLANDSIFLEADADNPKPPKPNSFITLSSFSKESRSSSLTTKAIQNRYGVAPTTAINLVRETSSYSNLYKKAKSVQAEEELQRSKDYFRLASKWQNTSLWISILAKNSVDDQIRLFQDADARSLLTINETEIADALKSSANKKSKFASPFQSIINLSRALQQQAAELTNRDSKNNSYMDSKRLTKHNGWDENALIAVIFEVFCLLYSRFIDVEMFSRGQKLYVRYSSDKNSSFYKALKDTLVISSNEHELSRTKQVKEKSKNEVMLKTNNPLSQQKLNIKISPNSALELVSNNSNNPAVFADLYSFVDSFEKEIDVKNLLISHLQSISYLIDSQANNVEKIFNTKSEDLSVEGTTKFNKQEKTEKSMIRRYLAVKASTAVGRDLLTSMTEHQLSLQRISDKNIFRDDDDISYVSSELIISKEEITALKSFANSPGMLAPFGSNVRVLSVGIPREMIDILQNPPYLVGSKNNSEINSTRNVFEVHVHKRDLEFEDIVFKPKKFTFDRSLFLLPTAFKKIQAGEIVENLLQENVWKFDNVVNNVTFTIAKFDRLIEKTTKQLYEDTMYVDLSKNKKQNMVMNHIKDRLLQTYYRLINGLTIDENTFIKHQNLLELFVDSDAANLLRLAQIEPATLDWVNTGTVPVSNLLINVNVYGEKLVRVATLKDAEIFTKPSVAQLASLARDLRIANLGIIPRNKYRKSFSSGKFRKIVDSKSSVRNQPKSLTKKLPPPPLTKKPSAPAATTTTVPKENKNKVLDQKAKDYFTKIKEEDKKVAEQRSKMLAYQRETFAHLQNRFFMQKPMLSAEQIQQFRMLCASTIFNPKVSIRKILSPKLFDRVFMIAVDPDDFEIDLDATRKLLSNKTSQDRAEFSTMVTITKDQSGREIAKLKPRRRVENYSSFNDFFVTISTIATGGNS